MATWLFKEEPAHYGFDQLERDGRTTWSGVKNALAQKHLRSVKKGDRVLYYHTGGEKAVVAVATAAGDAHPDPDDESGKSFVVEIVPGRRLARPVTLAEMKAAPVFAGFDLVRLPRLSVMPVSDAHFREIEKRGRVGVDRP
jgi:predicted RNA-binding protein with PUA-like domain